MNRIGRRLGRTGASIRALAEPAGVLIGASLLRRVRVTEVNLDSGVDAERFLGLGIWFKHRALLVGD